MNGDHDEAIGKMLAESQRDLGVQLQTHWTRIMANDCRDSEGDLVVVSEWARKRFNPPRYKVEPQRWADCDILTPGPLTGGENPADGKIDAPCYVWAREGTAGYPPQQMITAGITGTESMFPDHVHETELDARLAAWADYDERMAPVWAAKVNPGG
ncbi:MAG: hypothetical protein VW516_05945 [Rhodospirillaceae bacterium]|jgi:hypothetical protein